MRPSIDRQLLADLVLTLVDLVSISSDLVSISSRFRQLVAYFVLTLSEVLVSVTGLEFSYTQAPPAMKSMVMAFYLSAVAAGNLVTVAINTSILNADGSSR